jgi:hypothetical protein
LPRVLIPALATVEPDAFKTASVPAAPAAVPSAAPFIPASTANLAPFDVKFPAVSTSPFDIALPTFVEAADANDV